MKLSCLPVSYFRDIIEGRMSLGQWASQAVRLGLNAIDVSILFFRNHEPGYVGTARNEIEAEGMRVAVLNTYPDFTHPDEKEREKQIAQCRKDIETAGQIGAGMVRITAGQAHPGLQREEGISRAVQAITGLVDTARNAGVVIVYENHSKPGVWEYPDFSHPTDIFLEIAGALDGTPVRILFDTANAPAYGDDPIPLLKKVIDRVACVHAADIKSFGALEPVVIGTGIVPFRRIFMMLQDAGYDGWISIEEASGCGEMGVEQAVRFVRNTWEEAAQNRL